MTAFGDYAQYYNLLYKNKDYQGESDFVISLIDKYAPDTKTVLDLGCGTGRHDYILSEKYDVTGVDISKTMLAMAEDFRTQCSLTDSFSGTLPQFIEADVRYFESADRFDAVISLFHVMSYQITNTDLKQALATAQKHLKPGGVFLFDFWYGPGVITDKPVQREKVIENRGIKIIRTAVPDLYPTENRVDVNYKMDIEFPDKTKEIVHETHKMRYLFLPELKELLSQVGLEVCELGEWLTGGVPGFESWNAYCVSRKSK